jgi:hypothetical protein
MRFGTDWIAVRLWRRLTYRSILGIDRVASAAGGHDELAVHCPCFVGRRERRQACNLRGVYHATNRVAAGRITHSPQVWPDQSSLPLIHDISFRRVYQEC